MQIVPPGQRQRVAVGQGPQAHPAAPHGPPPGKDRRSACLQGCSILRGGRDSAPLQFRQRFAGQRGVERGVFAAWPHARAQQVRLLDPGQRNRFQRALPFHRHAQRRHARADRGRQRPVHPQQHAKATCDGLGKRGAARPAEDSQRARIDDRQVEIFETFRRARRRSITESDARPGGDFNVQVKTRIGGPAAQVAELGVGRAGQQQGPQRHIGGDLQRDPASPRIAAFRIQYLDGVFRQARSARLAGELEAAAILQVGHVHDLASGIQQLHAAAGQALDLAADRECGPGRHPRGGMQMAQARGQGCGFERQ